MTEDAYAFVSGPAHGRDLHRRVARRRRSSAARASTAPHTGVAAARRRRRRRRARQALADILAYLPSRIDEEPPAVVDRRPRRPAHARGGRLHPRLPHRRLRRARRRPRHRRRRRPARAAGASGRRTSSPRFATIGGRPVGIVANQPMSHRRHARHPRLAEGRPLRRLLRRLQPPAPHARRHARLLPGQGPRVARDDPPRRPARLRLRPGDGARGWPSCCARPTAAPTSSWTAARWAATSTSPGRRPRSR